MAEIVFWGAVLLLVHTYFLYPLFLFLMDGVLQVAHNIRFLRSGRCERRPALPEEALPQVSLVVAAYNEAACIGEKLRNSLALDYPPERLEVRVGSDGSTDGTDEIVRQCRDERVRLWVGPRAGKVSVLNHCISEACGEIIVLSDANTQIEPQALRRLVRHFQDPEVGAVCGQLRLYNPTLEGYEESAYWAYESLIKLYEGKRGVVMGANGALYAIRRKLFTALPPHTIVDDFVIPLKLLEQGYKVAYEPAAVAWEETTEDYGREFKRRARIAAGNFQSLRLVPGLLSPLAGLASFSFWSHKVLRWSAPALMALALVANLWLLEGVFYRLMLAAQVLFYALAGAGRAGLLVGPARRVALIAWYFVSMNAAIAVGFWRFLRKTQGAAWERTARAEPALSVEPPDRPQP